MVVTRGNGSVRRMGSWARRMLQGAVAVAVTASVPAAWCAGQGAGLAGVQVNNVAAGQAAISGQGSVMTIRTMTQNTIINYQRLSVGSGETLQFLQPTSSSRVLNRIQGWEPSRIDGTIESNGKVYLVNPAGVMFGKDSVINAAGFIAAAGHISDSNFMGGNNLFTGNTGAVVNQGVIRAQEIHLVGGSVANFGQIVTTGNGGVVTMTAGNEVYIGEVDSPAGSPSVMVKVSADKSAIRDGTGVTNSGKVEAQGGVISMGAGDLYAAGIYNNGTLKAASISLKAGANTAVTEGAIDAGSATGKGGKVEILGEKVGVFAGTVDASGATGGGEIKIGGDFHGDPGTQAASMTVVGPDAQIRADAILGGDGGQVAVWSSDVTQFYGAISARGGALGGNGGFVEVSGKKNLAFAGGVDVGAAAGLAGTILLDPANITINSNGTGTPSANFSASGNSSFSFAATAVQALTGSVIFAADDNITIAANLTFTGSSVTSFSLFAGSAINVNDNISVFAGSQPLSFHAGSSIGLGNNSVLSTNGGAVLLDATGVIDFSTGAGIATRGASVTLTSANDITFHSTGSFVSSTGSGTGGAILISGDNLIFGNQVKFVSGGGAISLVGKSSIGPANTSNDVLISSGGGDITYRTNTPTFGNSSTISAGSGTVAFETYSTASISPVTIGLGSGAGTLSLSSSDLAHVTSAGKIRIGVNGSQSGAVSVKALSLGSLAADLEINANSGTGTITIDDNNATGIAAVGNVTLRAGSGGIVVSKATGGNPEVSISGSSKTLTLVSAGGIGSTANRFEIASFTGVVDITNSGADLFVTGLGSLNFVKIANPANITDVVSAGDINATGVISGTNILLNASGGIGTTAAVAINPATGGTLTTAGAGTSGNIHLLLTMATLSGLTFATAGTTQIITLDAPSDFSLGGGFTAPSNDSLVVNASGALFAAGATITGSKITLNSGLGGAGSLDVSGATLTSAGTVTLHAGSTGTGNLNAAGSVITGDTIVLQAGSGAGNASLSVAGATLSGLSGSPQLVTLEQDASLATIPAFGTSTALTLISHAGTLTISQDEDLKSLTAQGQTIQLAGNATVSGNMSFTGQLVLMTDTTLVGTGGTSGLTVNNAIASDTGLARTLTTNFAGVTLFKGDVGASGTGQLGALTVAPSGGTVTFGNGSAVNVRTTGAVDVGQITTLNGNLTVAAGGSVTFGSTIDATVAGGSSLTVNSPGVTWFKGNIGAGAALGGVHNDSQSGVGEVTQLGNGGAFSIAVASPITFDDDVVLMANTTLTAGGSAATSNVTFNKTLSSQSSSAFTLAVNANGIAAFKGIVGDPSIGGELGSLAVTAPTITLGSGGSFSINTQQTGSTTGAQALNGKVILLADTTLTAMNGTVASTTGTVTLGGLVSSGTAANFTLAVSTDAPTIFSGGTSTDSTTMLGSILVSGAGSVSFGAGTVVTSGAQTYNGEVVLSGITTFQGSNLAFTKTGTAIDAGTFDLTIASNAASFGGAVTGAGSAALTLEPLQTTHNIRIQAASGTLANTLVLSASDLSVFTGFASTTIGYSNGSGTFTVAAGASPSFGTSTVLQMPSGQMVIASDVTSGGNLTVHAGTISLGANLVTNGGTLTLNGVTTLAAGGTVTLRSWQGVGAAGPIIVQGSVDGAQVLDLDAKGPGGSAAVDLQASVGTGTRISGLNVSGSTFTIHSDIATSGPIHVDASSMLVAGNSVISTNGGLVDVTAPIDAAAGHTGTVDLSISTSASGAAAAISLASVGATRTLRNLTLDASGGTPDAVTLADVSLAGALSSRGDTFQNTGVITATGVTLTHSGAVTVGNDILSPSGAVVLIGSSVAINSGAPVSGSTVSIGDVTGVTISDTVTAPGGFTSTGNAVLSFFTLATGGAISTTGLSGNVVITHVGGAGSLQGPIAAGAGSVTLSTFSITSNSSGTVTGGAIALLGNGAAVNLGAPVGASGALSISGSSIITQVGATLGGSSIGLNAGTGLVALNATATASGGSFTSTGGIFTNNALISAAGVGINHTGTVNINAGLSSAGSAVSIKGGAINIAAVAAPVSGSTITIQGSGLVTVGSVVTASSALAMTGSGVTTLLTGSLAGSTVGINGIGGGVTINAGVLAPNGFTSTSTGDFTLNGPVGAITVASGNAAISHSGSISLSGQVNVSGTTTLSGAGAAETVGGGIQSGALVLSGTGTFDLSQPNTVSTLAADVTGDLTLTNGVNLAIGAAGSPLVTGVNTHGGALSIDDTGFVLSVNQPITAGATTLTAGTVTGGGIAVTGPLTVTGNVVFSGTVSASTNVSITGDAVLNSVLTAAAGTIGITGNASGTGSINAPGAGGDLVVGGLYSVDGNVNVGRNIALTGGVDVSSGGTLTAGGTTTLAGGVVLTGSVATAVLSISGSSAINGNLSASGNILIGALATDVTTLVGAHSVTSTGGSITFIGPVVLSGATGPTTLSATSGRIVVNGSVSGAHPLQAVAGGFLGIAGNVVLTGTGVTSLQGGSIVILGNVTSAQTLSLNSGSGIVFNGVVVLTGSGTSAMTASGATGIAVASSLTSSQNLNLSGGTIGIGTSLTLTGTGTSTLAASGAGGITVGTDLASAQNLVLSAASGPVGISGALVLTGSGTSTLTAASAFSVGGSLSSSQVLAASGSGVSVTGPVDFTGTGASTLTASGAGGVALGADVTSSQTLALLATAGSLGIVGALGLTGSGTTSLTGSTGIGIGGSLTSSQNLVAASSAGPVSITGAVDLTGSGLSSFSSGGSGVSLGSTLDTAQKLLVDAASGGISITGAATFTGTGTSSLSSGTSGITLGSTLASSQNLALNTSGAIGVTGAVTLTGTGTTTLSASGASGITIGGSLTSSQVLALNASAGPVSITGDVTLTSGGSSSITSGGTGIALDAGLDSADHLTLSASSGSIGVTGAAAFTGTGASLLTAGGAAGITLGSTLDSSQNLTLAAASGPIDITGAVTFTGSGDSALSAGGASGITLGSSLDSSQHLTLAASAGSIGITGSVAFTGTGSSALSSGGSSGISIGGTVSSSQGLLLAAGGTGGISLGGELQLTGTGVTGMTSSGATGITVASAITGTQDLTFVTTSSLGVISVGPIGVSTSDRYTGPITFLAGSALDRNGVELRGDAFVDTITFKDNHLEVPRVATIIARTNLLIDAATAITMEANQKLSVLGSLTLRSHAPSSDVGMTLGDLSALGTIVIDAGGTGSSNLGRINFVLRAAQSELNNANHALPTDGGMDIVSYSPTAVSALDAGFGTGATAIAIRGAVSVKGVGLTAGSIGTPGQFVQVSSFTAQIDVTPSSDLATATLLFPSDQGGLLTKDHKAPILPRIITLGSALNAQAGDLSGIGKSLAGMTAADLAIGLNPATGVVIDLVPTGASGDVPNAASLAALIPHDVQTLFPERGQAISGAMLVYLQELGIFARDLDSEELIEELLGRGLYDDAPRVLTPLPNNYTVAVNRLPYVPVLPVVEAARKLMYREVLDEKGNPVMVNGKPKMESNAANVSKILATAWQAYSDELGAKNQEPKPAGFRAYLEAHEKDDVKFAAALNYLNQIRDLLAQIKLLGLTPTEYDISRRVILKKLRDENVIDEADFPQMIDGPSTRGAAGNTVALTPASAPAAAGTPASAPAGAPVSTPAPATQP